MVFVCPGIYIEIYFEMCPAMCLEIFLARKNIKKITVSRNLRHAHLLEVGLMQTLGDHETLSKVRHVGLLVDFSSMKSSLNL